MDADLPPFPTRIGRFVVLGPLGQGATSQVFLAHDPHLDRQVAIKWLQPAGGGTEEAPAPRFDEAKIVAQLDHPNIVPLYEAGVFRTAPYLVFARIQGETLAQRLARRGHIPAPEAMALLRDVVDGVAHAHVHGILHLDLSPGNVIIDAQNSARVMDFGQARQLGEGGDGLAGNPEDSVFGTPRYMAPEHLFGRAASARSDVFSLGLIFYELLTGRKALPGRSLEAIATALSAPALDLPLLGTSGVDEALQAVVRRALSLRPEDRYADARELKHALEDALRTSESSRQHATVEFLLARMQRKANFPALSNNLMDINRLTGEESLARTEELAQVVMRDYAMTNRLLKLANSSYFGRPGRGVGTVSEAVRLLGTRAVRLTCNSLAYLGAFQGGALPLKDAMVTSFACALVARHLALRLGRRDLAEEAFVCGMFSTLGKSLALFYFEEEYAEIERLVERARFSEEEASERVLGIAYSGLAHAVAQRWRFPAAICESVRPPKAGVLPAPASDVEMLQHLAAFGAELSELILHCPKDEAGVRLAAFAARFRRLGGMTVDETAQLLRQALEKLEEFAPVLGLDLRASLFVRRTSTFLQASLADTVVL